MSYNEIGRALNISKSAAGKYVSLARVAGVDWAIAQTLTDEALEARLYRPSSALVRRHARLVGDLQPRCDEVISAHLEAVNKHGLAA